IAEWTDAADDLLTHLVLVAKQIGAAQKTAFQAPRAGVIVAGFEVPHLHVHVFPSWGIDDFDFSRVDNDPDPGEMDRAMEKLRGALREAGLGTRVPD
nr:HIT family protein [Pseudonocardiales bacterium]